VNNTLSIKVITSFNQQYYDMIGQRCVETWADYWPLQCQLDCYVEGFDYESADPRINSIPFSCLPPEYEEFQASELGGRVKIFAKKAYSIIHAFENVTTDRLVWLDADTVTTGMIPMLFLESLCPDDTLATFMGVWHNMDRDDPSSELKFSGETGVFVVNTQHPGFGEFAKRYTEYYNQRLHHNLRRFYDGEVFGAVVQELKNQYKFRDLSAELKKAYNSPLKHTELGKYLIHYKSKHSKQDFVDQRQ
jgi:lipopolysaccharide biosynthesis glycosyltransferase